MKKLILIEKNNRAAIIIQKYVWWFLAIKTLQRLKDQRLNAGRVIL